MSKSVEVIQARAGAGPVKLGLILGSGLGHLAAAVEGVSIPYCDLPGFPHVGVSGHNPDLVVGWLEGVRVGERAGRGFSTPPAARRARRSSRKTSTGGFLIAHHPR